MVRTENTTAGRTLAIPARAEGNEIMHSEIEEFLRRALEGMGQPTPSSDDEVLDAEILEDDGVAVVEAVEAVGRLQTSFQPSRLGQEVALADDRMDARLHKAFDHNVGQLSSRQETTDALPAASARSLADDVRQALRSQTSVRNAVVLNEILQRPEHRW